MTGSLLATLFCLVSLSAMANGDSSARDAHSTSGGLNTIAALDVERYMGTWYEIAKYPNWFQKKCAVGTKAEYSLMTDGRVQVINRCRTADGGLMEAIGVARQIGPATSPKLEVRFAPAWLSFLPFVWGNYWIIDLDEDYQLVAVSEPSKEYLWILARAPKLDPVRYNALLNRLRQQRFDLDKLEVTKQN